MTGTAAEQLKALHEMVVQAKNVPMSASCMLNRAEVLGIIERIQSTLADELAEAERVRAQAASIEQEARDKADATVAEAEKKADQLVRETLVYTDAKQRAEKMTADATAESEELRREVDSYVDGHIATFEAGLQKVLSQVQTMRARLAERSHLDERAQFDSGDA